MNNTSNTLATTPPPTLTPDSAAPSPSPEGGAVANHARACDANASGHDGLASSKQQDVMQKLSNPSDEINLSTSLFVEATVPLFNSEDVSPVLTNRNVLLGFVQRCGEISNYAEARLDALKLQITGCPDARMDIPSDLKMLRELALTLAGEEAVQPFDFLARLCDTPDWCSTLELILSHFGWRRHKTCMQWGQNPCILNQWMVKKAEPNAKGRKTLTHIAEYHGIPVDLFLSKCPRFVLGRLECHHGVTSAGIRQQEMSAKEYLLKLWPVDLEDDWQFLYKHKTSATGAGLLRHKPWRIKRGTACHTAKTVRTQLERFFGFLILPKYNPDPDLKMDPQLCGMGFKAEELSFALLADEELVLAFLKFLEVRAGMVNEGQRMIIGFFCGFLQRTTGFIPQQPRYADHPHLVKTYGTDATDKKGWKKRCKKARARLKQERAWQEKNRAYKISKATAKIDDILDDPNPARFLTLLMAGMALHAPSARKGNDAQALHSRDRAIIEILSHVPVRSDQLRHTTYREDQCGNLYKNKEGRFHLRYIPDDFKVWPELFTQSFDAPLPERSTAVLDEYLKFRRRLADADTCDYLFRPSKLYNKGCVPNQPMQALRFSNMIRAQSARHLKGWTTGFTVHDFRDILATTLVKRFPKGIYLASRLLYCTTAMIERHYGRWATSKVIGHIQETIYATAKAVIHPTDGQDG